MEINSISLIVPCFNEEKSIGAFYQRTQALVAGMHPREVELIFVNDGSGDRTGDILNDLAAENPEVKVLHLAQNRGHQIALTAGMDHAGGDVIITIDSDLQQPPELIRDMIQKIEDGYDIVHAQRKHRSGDKWLKLATARAFYYFMRYFSGVRLIENCGDFRAFTTPVLEIVNRFRMPHRFLRGIFVQTGFRQCVLQYESDVRHAGDSKYTFLKMMNLAIDGVLGFSAAPIRIITWLTILLWGVSLVHLTWALIDHFVFQNTVPGWTSIIVLMFFFTGLILFSIAIIGSYVGRIFVQGQSAPLYWLQDARNLDYTRITKHSGELFEIQLAQKTVTQRQGQQPL